MREWVRYLQAFIRHASNLNPNLNKSKNCIHARRLMRQRGGKKGERCEERGKKGEGKGEEMSYHASIRVGVQLY